MSSRFSIFFCETENLDLATIQQQHKSGGGLLSSNTWFAHHIDLNEGSEIFPKEMLKKLTQFQFCFVFF